MAARANIGAHQIHKLRRLGVLTAVQRENFRWDFDEQRVEEWLTKERKPRGYNLHLINEERRRKAAERAAAKIVGGRAA